MSSAKCQLCSVDSYVYTAISSCCFPFPQLKWKAGFWNERTHFITIGAAVVLYGEVRERKMLRMISSEGWYKTLIKGRGMHRRGASVCTGTLWHWLGVPGCVTSLLCVCVCVCHQPQLHNLAFVLSAVIVLIMQSKERLRAIKNWSFFCPCESVKSMCWMYVDHWSQGSSPGRAPVFPEDVSLKNLLVVSYISVRPNALSSVYFLEDKVSLSCGYTLLSETEPHLQSTSPQSQWGNADNFESPGLAFGYICHFCSNLEDRDRSTVRLASPPPQPAKLFLILLCFVCGYF